jgi:predicted anti-sigma-YlaC factor YlaD
MTGRHGLRHRVHRWMKRGLHGAMNCAEFDAALVDYLDGAMTPLARFRVRLHIRTCPRCARYLRAYDRARRLAVESLRHSEQQALASVPEDLVQAILAARRAEAALERR